MLNKINTKEVCAVVILGTLSLMVGCGSSSPTGTPTAVAPIAATTNSLTGCMPISQPIYFTVPGATLERSSSTVVKIFAGLVPTLPQNPDPIDNTPGQYAEPKLTATNLGLGNYSGNSPLNGSQISFSYYTAQNQAITSASSNYLVNVTGRLIIGSGIQSNILRQFPAANINSVCLNKIGLSVQVYGSFIYGRAYLYVNNATQVGGNGVYINFTN